MSFKISLDEIATERIKQIKRRHLRRSIVGAILGGALGIVLGLSGNGITTWSFWAICAINVATILNAGL